MNLDEFKVLLLVVTAVAALSWLLLRFRGCWCILRLSFSLNCGFLVLSIWLRVFRITSRITRATMSSWRCESFGHAAYYSVQVKFRNQLSLRPTVSIEPTAVCLHSMS